MNVRVPFSQSNVRVLKVSDSLYGSVPVGNGVEFDPKSCPAQGQSYVCTAKFFAPSATNDLRIDAYTQGSGTLLASGTFPVTVAPLKTSTAWAVLSGNIASLEVDPFLGDTLPISETEGAWIVAKANDQNQSVIIGSYQPQIHLSAGTVHLNVTPSVLKSSRDGEHVHVKWSYGYLGNDISQLVAEAGSIGPVKKMITPADGIVYFPANDDSVHFSPGPLTIGRDGNIYFAINDATGCGGSPRTCRAEIVRFDTTVHRFTPPIPLTVASGVKQMFVDTQGAIWMSTYQTTGSQYGNLPTLRLESGQFIPKALATLPPDYDQASGFTEDANGNIWISRCQGACSGSGGTPMVVETTDQSWRKPPLRHATLPLGCTPFSASNPFYVGDAAYQNAVYVIGQSVSPGSGTIWKVYELQDRPPKTACVSNLPAGFSPALYFSRVNGAQIFGIRAKGGASAHGFYKLFNGGVTSNTKPQGRATQVSAFDGLLYYVATDPSNKHFNGVGTYQPSNGKWNVFPTIGFTSSQFQNGVAASEFGLSKGGWFLTSGTFNQRTGIWLGVLVYTNPGSPFGAIPQLLLPPTPIGTDTGFGVVTNPSPPPSQMAQPFNAHSGPFLAQSHNPTVCNVVYVAPFTFAVRGLHSGPCPITITDQRTHRVQPLVTKVQ